MIQRAGFSKPEPEEVAYIFDQLELNERVDLINPNETIKLEYMDAEFIYVSLCDNNSYFIAKKEGNAIGAVNYCDGKRSIVLPKYLQPELICVVINYFLWGQSSISVIACPLIPIAIFLYPADQELHNALYECMLERI